jgi:hypothetical protein
MASDKERKCAIELSTGYALRLVVGAMARSRLVLACNDKFIYSKFAHRDPVCRSSPCVSCAERCWKLDLHGGRLKPPPRREKDRRDGSKLNQYGAARGQCLLST